MKYILIFLLTVKTILYSSDVNLATSKPCNMHSLKHAEIKQLFMHMKSQIADQAITALDTSDAVLYKEFIQEYLLKTPQQMRVYWTRMIFTGTRKPPRKLKLGKQVKNRCCISYFYQDSLPNTWAWITITNE